MDSTKPDPARRASQKEVRQSALELVLFGGGRRLFENLREPGPEFRIERVLDGAGATQLRYVGV